jgi:DNA-binding XRE family transcriptional regulator
MAGGGDSTCRSHKLRKSFRRCAWQSTPNGAWMGPISARLGWGGIGPFFVFVGVGGIGERKVTRELVKFPMEVPVHRADDCGMGVLGTNLREAREKLGLTQEQVAERSGVHATEVSRIEAGKRDPQISTLERLAEAVGVKPGQLLE